MLARSRSLGALTEEHRLVGPLLVPSVSSKGFPVCGDGLTEPGTYIQGLAAEISDALLISAYDIYHRMLPETQQLQSGGDTPTFYSAPMLLIVDSGGYELNPEGYENGLPFRGPHEPHAFSRAEFETVIDRLPRELSILAVSYDDPINQTESYEVQVELAKGFFRSRPHLRSDFLMKPVQGEMFLDYRQISEVAGELRDFDVVGVTEKELGGTSLERLVMLARIRLLLDRQGAGEIPIHIFGCLDPIMTSLYFMVGGEIFDGLSWLRYAFHDGLAIHPDESSLLLGRIEDTEVHKNMYRLVSNLRELKTMKQRLAHWAGRPDDFEILGCKGDSIRAVYERVLASLPKEDQHGW